MPDEASRDQLRRRLSVPPSPRAVVRPLGDLGVRTTHQRIERSPQRPMRRGDVWPGFEGETPPPKADSL
jgi:hypothetical protein